MVPEALRFRNIRATGPEAASQAWIHALSDSTVSPVSAWNLYKGDHWHVVRDLARLARPVRVWVCSAGYGLVEAGSLLKPYAATFSVGHADSISSEPEVLQAWWDALSRWRPCGIEGPRSFKDAFAQYRDDRWLVVLSAPYLRAVKADLSSAVGVFGSEGQMSIVSSSPTGLNGLADSHLPVDERFQTLLSGAKMSLNVRVARWVLSEASDLGHHTLLEMFAKTLDQLERPDRPDRKPLTDLEVKEFIRPLLTTVLKPSASALLRRLRGQGMACEQSRFSRLFAESVTEAKHV